MYMNKSMVNFWRIFALDSALGWVGHHIMRPPGIPGFHLGVVAGLWMLEVSRMGGEKTSSIPKAESSCCRHDGVVSHMAMAQGHLMADLPRMTGSKLQHSVLERYKAPFWIWTTPVVKCGWLFSKGPPKRISNQRILRLNSFRFFSQQKSAQDPLLLSTLGPAMLTMTLFTAWGAGTGHRAPGKRFGDHQPAHVLHDSCCRSGAALRHCPTKHRGTSRSDLWLLRVTWRSCWGDC